MPGKKDKDLKRPKKIVKQERDARERLLTLLTKDQIPDEYSALTVGGRGILVLDLTLSQWKFVREYCVHMKPGAAAAAVYSVANPVSATNIAIRLLANPKIKAAIALVLAEYGAKTDIKKDALVYLAMQIATNENAKDADKVKAIELVAKMTNAIVDEKRRSDDSRIMPKIIVSFDEKPTSVRLEEERAAPARTPKVVLEHDGSHPLDAGIEDPLAPDAEEGARISSE